jgi:hypothetical protein
VPITGGQKVVQLAVHFELVGVSMTNQYRVNPAELVRTDPRLVLLVFSVAVWLAAWLAGWLAAGAADVLAELAAPPYALLPQAARTVASRTAKTANVAGSHLW